MYARTPRLEIHPARIQANARVVCDLVHGHGAQVAAVGKVVRSHPAVVAAMIGGGADMVADSRIFNLMSLAELGTSLPHMLLRLSAPSAVADVVRCADITLNSSLHTLRLLSDAAVAAHRPHAVIVMVDVGDLREGVWPDLALDLIADASRLPGVDVIGVGANLACYGGVVPTADNMRTLVDVRDAARAATGLPLKTISGGNSAALPLLVAGGMPPEVNHFRIGEAIVLGRNVLDRSPWPGTRQDTFRLVGEVVEVERKPSVPIGVRAQNAFGESTWFDDRGMHLRAIVNLGRQDTDVSGLCPQAPGVRVLGGSSDHLILDVEDADRPVRPGDEIGFDVSYSALLGAATSPYVQRVVMPE